MPMKWLVASRKQRGFTRADYHQLIEFRHGIIARQEWLKIRSYIQDHVIDGAFGMRTESPQQVTEPDAIVEICFDDASDLRSFIDAVPSPDISNGGTFFAAEQVDIAMVTEEEELTVPNSQSQFGTSRRRNQDVDTLKVLQYIMRNKEIPLEDFSKYWREAHEKALEEAPYAKEQLRRCVLNRRLPISGNPGRKGCATDSPVYDLIVSHWFDTMGQMGAFRQYNEVLQSCTKNLVNWAQSFFLYTKEIVIIPDTPREQTYPGPEYRTPDESLI
jgi:EthD domain